MARRKIKNLTGLPRIKDKVKRANDVWLSFVCVKCSFVNIINAGKIVLDPIEAYENERWKCAKCKYAHNKDSNLPFKHWPKKYTDSLSITCQRFWQGFFRIATEKKEIYWKWCNTCGRVLSFNAFDRHKGWGDLEKQMECRSCKSAINAVLNPKRTKEQLQEGNIRRRIGDLLLKGENERLDHKALFKRFDGKCFKTGKKLDIKKRSSWAVDHVLPSRYLYPLTEKNAALLSREANNNKRDNWPSKFYKNTELKKLAKIIGADLSLISSPKPIVNTNIDVDKCVSRFLEVREGTDLSKRIRELKKLLADYSLVGKLSAKNKTLLGFK